MELKTLSKILGVSAGICAILSGLLWWWWVIFPGGLYGLSTIDGLIYIFNNSWFAMLDPRDVRELIFYIFGVGMLIAGIITIISGAKSSKKGCIISLILIVTFGILLLVYEIEYFIATDMSFSYFFIYLEVSGAFLGQGPGFYLGISSIALEAIAMIAVIKAD
ncbi:MAG: hypothetical protein ACTSX4_09580 [Candidatus Helarchaeota archaeon]